MNLFSDTISDEQAARTKANWLEAKKQLEPTL